MFPDLQVHLKERFNLLQGYWVSAVK